MEQVTLDLIPVGAKTVCHASQYDIGRTIRFNLVNNNQPVTLAGTETIVVKITKPDGTKIEKNLSNTSSTYVDWVTGEGDCDQAGIYNCEIKLTDGSAELGSKNFTIKVEEDPYNGEEVITETVSGDPAVFTTNLVDLFVEIKCNINAIQEGTPWIDSNIVNKEPYLYRKIAGTASRIGNSEFNKIVGGTADFNQLVVNGATSPIISNDVTATKNTDNSWDISGTASDNVVINIDGGPWKLGDNHVYFIAGSFSGGSASTFAFGLGGLALDFGGGTIWKNSNHYLTTFSAFVVGSGVYVNLTKVFFRIHDLTQMFGPTIADYIYNLETNTAGAGVAWFRKYYPKVYYPYNISSLMSSIPVAKRVIGKNLLNASVVFSDTAYFTINTDGSVTQIAEDARAESAMPKIHLEAGTYTISRNTNVGNMQLYYNDNGTWVWIVNQNTPSYTFTLTKSVDCYYKNGYATFPMTFYPQIEIGSTATAYEPYKETIIDLGGDTLRGIPKLDSNNKLYYDGDIKTSDGKIKRRYGIVNLGDLNWVYGGGVFTTYDVNDFPTTASGWEGLTNFKCSDYSYSDWDLVDNPAGHDKQMCMRYVGGQYYTRVSDSDYTDAAVFKAAMNGVYLVYELATPTTEQSTAFTNPVTVDANGSEEFVDGNVYGIVDLGSLEWQKIENANGAYFYGGLGTNPQSKANAQCICEQYQSSTAWFILNTNIDDAVGVEENYIVIRDTSYNDAVSFKTAMSGIYLIYEKASSTGVEIPVGHESFYADIYQISGHTELSLTRRGVNLLNTASYEDGQALGIYLDALVKYADASKCSIVKLPLKAGTYTLSHNGAYSDIVYACYYYDNNEAHYINNAQLPYTFTLPTDAYVGLTFSTMSQSDVGQFMLNTGSTPLPYEPYNRQTVIVQFGQTVYGGVLDVTTGKLTINKAIITFNGTEDWLTNGDRGVALFIDNISPAIDTSINPVFEIYQTLPAGQGPVDNGKANFNNPLTAIQIHDERAMEAEEYVKVLASNNLRVLFALANPTEIQLTAHQLETILGQNILSHDCNGTTEVKYLYNA